MCSIVQHRTAANSVNWSTCIRCDPRPPRVVFRSASASAGACAGSNRYTRMAGARLEDLQFDNRTLRALPLEDGPNENRAVRGACFSRVQPLPLRNVQLVAYSEAALALLGLDAGEVST